MPRPDQRSVHRQRSEEPPPYLTAAGFEPTISRLPRFIRIEVVPRTTAPARWRALLSALERADRFGLDSGTGTATAWAHVFADDGDASGHLPADQP